MDHTDEYQLYLLFEGVAKLCGYGQFEEAIKEAERGTAILRDVLHELQTEGGSEPLPQVQVQDMPPVSEASGRLGPELQAIFDQEFEHGREALEYLKDK